LWSEKHNSLIKLPMARLSKKRTAFVGLKPPHVGQMLRTYVKTNRLYQSGWARMQGMKPSTICNFFKKPTIPLGTLYDICQILKYNFFRDIADSLPAELPPFKTNELAGRVAELEKENEKLKNDIALLKEVIAMKS